MSPNPPSRTLLELPVTQFRGRLSHWLQQVSHGHKVVLTVDRRPVAVITDFGDYDYLRYLADRDA